MEEHVRDERRGRAANDESGQVLVLAALGMVMMLVMVALVVDIGKAYLVQRQLQAGVDAAALAGAQYLPDPTDATQAANDYGPSAGAKNAVDVGSDVTTTVTMRCVTSAPGCSSSLNAYNALNVKATSNVRTVFARILGIDNLTVKASATACSPCSSKPLDIMVVLDRTGSMCQYSNGSNDPACTDLNNAKAGISAFLEFMDPTLDKVGLAVLPPARNRSNLCATPTSGGARYGYDSYWPEWIPDTRVPPGTPAIYAIGSMVNDYLTPGPTGYVLNPSSSLLQRLGCVQGNGTTSYSNSIEEAQHELERNGTGGVQDVIIFLSDGAANSTPRHMPSYIDNAYNRLHPCAAGVAAANNAKGKGTIIYSIGYDLDGMDGAYEACRLYPSFNVDGTTTAYSAIRSIASEPDNFYNMDIPDRRRLLLIFTRIAADLQRPAARLIDDNTP
jgi:Flp pilus assembly protein TadG